MSSADETDDEEIPKKTVPNWASGAHLEAALVCQFSQPPPDLEGIFGVVSEPDLNQIFPLQNGPFRDRTSSASWDSPFWNPRIGTATLPTTQGSTVATASSGAVLDEQAEEQANNNNESGGGKWKSLL
ncbi:MAG: hypothetical protein GY820_42445 [Gammaproteobacteria bacterium]|nr:hypothetical protein [Gammaproteobacteria bacterium]